MVKKSNQNKAQVKTKSSSSKIIDFNYDKYKAANANKFLIIAILLFCIFLLSVFKNISYPLFWADEGMTAIGSERVLEYGYPKVHDGKNVFYDLKHSNPKLGISEKDDAYVGGTGWGQYYFGTIGYLLAEETDDIYLKTALYRTTFAIIGILGLLLIGFFISKIFPDNFSRFAFITLFLLLELMSVSLAMLLREARYYSLVMFLSCLIIGMYSSFRFYKPFNKIVFICIESIALWMLFFTFSPVYFIIILTVAISELIIFVYQSFISGFISSAKKALPVICSLAIALIGVYPFLSYFKTFEISKAMNEFCGYNNLMYWDNFKIVFDYFKKFELLFFAIILKIFLVFHIKKILNKKSALFYISNFLTLFFIVFIFAIGRIPNFIYTRYIIYLQPILAIIIILDFFMILKEYSVNSTKLINTKMMILIILFAGMYIFSLSKNMKYIKGHIYEMSHQYKGPLDYTIPYIQEKFPKPDTLVIAANYEEPSYMYYLKSKVIIGFTGNNLAEDSLVTPDIIAYRKTWNNYEKVFNGFLMKSEYEKISFPVYDGCVNNIPELNFKPMFNHKFKILFPENDDFAAWLFVRKKLFQH
ncbi:MAG TPA: hypothetical protein PKK00_04275 [Bacteroidales bacterium]|nr:hypothetical protein [Bacteroidales bacterium]HPS16603.1 hypothetical protein [Bacteroidales bacterium]